MADRWSLFQTCAAEAWSLRLGDPDAIGIALAIGYALAAALALTVVFRGPFRSGHRKAERALWMTSAAVLVVLALNKQLDLQVFVTSTARCVARAEGWYDSRRALQAGVTIWLILMAAVLVPLLLVWLRRAMRGNLLLIGGMILLVVFVLIRVVSFHHMDHFLRTDILSVRLHRWVEAAALGLVLFAGARRLVTRR
jgi:hypothetical protein